MKRILGTLVLLVPLTLASLSGCQTPGTAGEMEFAAADTYASP